MKMKKLGQAAVCEPLATELSSTFFFFFYWSVVSLMLC